MIWAVDLDDNDYTSANNLLGIGASNGFSVNSRNNLRAGIESLEEAEEIAASCYWSFCGNECCLCKRSSRQTTLVCVNAPRRNERLPLPRHLAAEITDTCSPSLYISLLLAQIDNIIQSFLMRTLAVFIT
jgi:hypothetical protein